MLNVQNLNPSIIDPYSEYTTLNPDNHLNKFAPNYEGLVEALDPMKGIFIPTWYNKPIELPAVLSLAGTSILTHQNLVSVIAHPGAGKSSACEAICAWHLNFQADSLNFEGNPDFIGLIYADFERTDTDVWNCFTRMAKRAIFKPGEEINKVVMAGMRSISRVAERKAAIIHLLETNPCSLLLLDGAGNLVEDTNDLREANECTIWLREITVKYGVSIFTTIHPNPGSDKPRGHIGSELCRESECVLLAKKMEGDIHILTTAFEYGKNRNNSDLTTAYKWDDEQMMFITTDVPAELSDGKTGSKKKLRDAIEFPKEAHLRVLQEIFKCNEEQTSGEFISNLCSVWNNKEGGEMKESRAKIFKSFYILEGFIQGKTGQKGNKTLHTLNDK